MDIPAPNAEHHASKYHVFMQIAMFLAIVTGIEIVIIFVPVSDFAQYATLAVLSLVKFLAVIFYFMHLRWDRVFCTVLFFIGLILGTGTLLALVALFKTDRTELNLEAETAALAPQAALVETTG
ncbi:MAG: hypothetical protein D6781_10135 [Verrucomicrobia bacterium]|nr:MAG: hypothetical protein D6781_10135 [Verrucomicrobiota bacterium]